MEPFYENNQLFEYLKYNNFHDLELIKKLKKINKNNDRFNNTALMYYCKNDNLENLDSEIINLFSDQIGIVNKEYETALLLYLEYNNNPSIDSIELLKDEFNLKNKFGQTPLMVYLYNNNLNINIDILKILYKNINIHSIYFETALTIYLQHNKNPSIDIIELLRNEFNIRGEYLNYTKTYYTPLMYYCMNMYIEKLNPEIINLFSNQIGLKDKCNNGETALMYYLSNNKNPSLIDINLLKDEIKVLNNYKQNALLVYIKSTRSEKLYIGIIKKLYTKLGLIDKFNNSILNCFNNRVYKNTEIENKEIQILLITYTKNYFVYKYKKHLKNKNSDISKLKSKFFK